MYGSIEKRPELKKNANVVFKTYLNACHTLSLLKRELISDSPEPIKVNAPDNNREPYNSLPRPICIIIIFMTNIII
jgi:hypothetical protein